MHTGNLNRAKKYNLEVSGSSARVVSASRGSAVPIPVSGKLLFSEWHRKKQFSKVATEYFLKEGYVVPKDLFDHLMGKRLVHPVKLGVIAAGFDRGAWEQKKKEKKVK